MTSRAARNRIRIALSTTAVAALAVAGVSVGIAGAQTTVSTEAELRAAFATDDSVILANDITLEDCTGGGALERTTADAVLLDGGGFTLTQTCPDNVVLQDTPGAELLMIQNLTITGGQSSGSGGGVFALGDLTIINSALIANHADDFGGGLATDGALVLDTTLVDGNTAGDGGGGIAGDVDLTINQSTISNNTLGGGIATSGDESAMVVVVNSTVTGNGGVETGGGIFSAGGLTLVYSTVTDNTATQGFGNLFTQSPTTIFGSVITGGTPENCLGGGVTSQGYNFSDDDSCNLDQPTDQEDAGDPQLGALGDNGGPTPTQLPADGSPLIGAIAVEDCQAGAADGVSVDQRGIDRPQDDGCDIGSVEVASDVVPVPLLPTPPAAPVAPSVPLTPRFTG